MAPGLSVNKTDADTSIIKEPGKREVTIRTSDLAKFGTKAERQTDLQIYANRRPKKPSGKITEDLINHLQPKVKIELKKLLNEGHMEKLTNCSDQFFISPIVITVKEDQSIKIASDSNIFNKAIHNNKYQMPNIGSLFQTNSQTLSTAPQETAYFTTLDLQYAYSQFNLHSDAAHHCNFILVSGHMTGTCRFKTGFYRLTDKPAECQKAID